MKTVILNWSRGENDPFTSFNKTIKSYLIKCGKDPVVLDVEDGNLVKKITDIEDGIDFVFTWQGIGSDLPFKSRGVSDNLWGCLQIPMVCIHADHPSQMPSNHVTENRYCTHAYVERDFAFYSNRHFRRTRSAEVVIWPLLHEEAPRESLEGDYFVFLKNITHPGIMDITWKERMDANLYTPFRSFVEYLKNEISSQTHYVDFHSLFDDFILHETCLHPLLEQPNFVFYHKLHSQVDFFVRNFKSVLMIERLKDFPVRIYGRGWDALKNRNKNHSFFDGLPMSESQQLYYSRYGLLDISASRGLHDRSLRALANKTGLLSSAYLNDLFPDIEQYSPLFFNFPGDDLIEKCERIVSNPAKHRELAADFSRKYQTVFHYPKFINRISDLSRSR